MTIDPFGLTTTDKRSVPFPAYLAKAKTIDPRNAPGIIKAPQVCKMVRLSWHSLKKLCDKKEFPHIRLGRFYLFEESKVTEFLMKNVVS